MNNSTTLFKTVTLPFAKSGKKISFVCISDTHERENEILNALPKADILIHSGDFTRGHDFLNAAKKLNAFFGQVQHLYKYIILVPGNHDLVMDTSKYKTIPHMTYFYQLFPNVTHLLLHSSCQIEGINFFGTSYGYYHSSEAFGKSNEERQELYAQIPVTTDILITHQPCFNILDLAWQPSQKDASICKHCHESHEGYAHWGCWILREHVLNRIKPKVHICGHVHDHYGDMTMQQTHFINAAMDWDPKMRKPVYFEYYMSK